MPVQSLPAIGEAVGDPIGEATGDDCDVRASTVVTVGDCGAETCWVGLFSDTSPSDLALTPATMPARSNNATSIVTTFLMVCSPPPSSAVVDCLIRNHGSESKAPCRPPLDDTPWSLDNGFLDRVDLGRRSLPRQYGAK